MTNDATDNALVRQDGTELVGLNREQINVLKTTVCKGYTDNEMALYLHQAHRLGLDPLSRETFTFKSGGQVVIGTAIDGFRTRADATGCYCPGRPTEYEQDDNGKLIKARVYVEKWIEKAGEWKEISEEAYFEEFRSGGPTWKGMPRVMLSKCAEARALRRAFPRQLSGMYVVEEFDAIRQNSKPPAPSDPFAPPAAPVEVDCEVVDGPPPAAPSDPFAPPAAPVEVDCEVVDGPPPAAPPPPRISPKRQVWDHAKGLGLNGNDVTAVLEKLGISTDSRTWKADDVKRICDGLDARAAEADIGEHLALARDEARDLGCTDEEWASACVEAFPDGLPRPFTPEHGNKVLAVVEQMKGV
jgi:phage recombination protein Bet